MIQKIFTADNTYSIAKDGKVTCKGPLNGIYIDSIIGITTKNKPEFNHAIQENYFLASGYTDLLGKKPTPGIPLFFLFKKEYAKQQQLNGAIIEPANIMYSEKPFHLNYKGNEKQIKKI